MDEGTGQPLGVLERGAGWTIVGWRNLAIVLTGHAGFRATADASAWLNTYAGPGLDTVVWIPARIDPAAMASCAPQIRRLASAGHSVVAVLPGAPLSLLGVVEAQARRGISSRQSLRLFSDIQGASNWLAWLGDAWAGHEALPEGYELVLWIATQLASGPRAALG